MLGNASSPFHSTLHRMIWLVNWSLKLSSRSKSVRDGKKFSDCTACVSFLRCQDCQNKMSAAFISRNRGPTFTSASHGTIDFHHFLDRFSVLKLVEVEVCFTWLGRRASWLEKCSSCVSWHSLLVLGEKIEKFLLSLKVTWRPAMTGTSLSLCSLQMHISSEINHSFVGDPQASIPWQE